MTPRRFSQSLVARLLIFGVLMVFVGGAARYVLQSRFLRDDLTQLVSAQQTALAEAAAQDIDDKVRNRLQLLERLAASFPAKLLEQPAALQAWLGERYPLNPLFSLGLLVADRQGRIIADFPPVPGRRQAMLANDSDFMRALAKTDGRAALGKPRLGPYTKQPALPMGIPIRDAQGRVQAILVGITALNAPDFLDRIRNGRIGESGGYLLISPADQLFLAAGDPDLVLKPTPPAGVNPLHDRAMAGYRGAGITTNAKGVEELSAMVGVPSAGWFVVARMPTEEAFATVRHAQELVVSHSFTASLIVILFTGIFLRLMLRPLHDAAELANRMRHGEIPLAPLPIVRDDEVGHLTGAFNQLLEKLADSRSRLEHMAHHDPLTGLANRTMLADRLRQARARARRNRSLIAVLFLDLDGFKPINDELGHDAGDAALVEAAMRLSGMLRQTDTLARVGGDEFVLLVADLPENPQEGLAILAGRCIEALSRPMTLNGVERRLGVSIGIALGGGDSELEAIMLAADQAMYVAKNNGRGGYAFAADAAPDAVALQCRA